MAYDRDYLPVALPTTDVQVLQVLTKARSVLRRYSRLDRILDVDPGVPAAEVSVDQPVVDTTGFSKRTTNVNVGLKVVSAIIQALGGDAGLEVKAGNARQVRFNYTNVVADRVDLATLDAWLHHATPQPELRNSADLLAAEKLYVIVGALKAGGVEVEFLDRYSAAVEVDVPAVQGEASGTVGLDTGGKRTGRLVFTGPLKLTVAAKAAQLRYDEHGIWVHERLRTSGEIRGAGPYTFLDGDVIEFAE